MAKNIRGITIEIDGNVQPLQSALKDVDKQAVRTAGELKEINNGLKFDSNNTVLLGQKFEVLQDAIANTSSRLDILRRSQSDVEAQFNSGAISAQQYRAFQREIERTEGILRSFQSQYDDVRVRINVDADTSGLNRIESMINDLPDDARQAGKEIGKNLAIGATAALGGLTALTVGMEDTNKQLSRLESQAKNATTAVGKMGQNFKQVSDESLELFEEALSMEEEQLKKSLDKQLKDVEKSYDQKERVLEKSLRKEMSALEKAQRQKLKLIDEEYEERLKLVDEEEYKRLKAIDKQIDAIDKQSEAYLKAQRLAQQKEQRADLDWAVKIARTAKAKEEAEKNLAKFEADVREENLQEERKIQVEKLKEQKEAIKDEFAEKKDAIRDEKTLRVEQLNEQLNEEKEALSEIQDLKKEKFREEKALYIETMREKYASELEEFKKANAQMVELRKQPITTPVQVQPKLPSANLSVDDFKDSRIIYESVKQDTDQAVEALGNLVAAGYTTRDDLTDISKGIAGAIQIYGDTFSSEGLAESIATTTNLGEVTGQLMDLLEKEGINVDDFNAKLQEFSDVSDRANYISDMFAKQGLKSVYDGFAESNPAIIDAAIAQVEFTDALKGFTTSLQPLLTNLTKLTTFFLEMINYSPLLTQIFVFLVSTLAVLAGSLALVGGAIHLLTPVLALFGTTIGALASGVIPALVAAITFLLSPIGLLIAGIALAATLWITRWEEIKEGTATIIDYLGEIITDGWESISNYVSDVSKSIADSVVSAFVAIPNMLKTVFASMVDFIVAPINGCINLINDFIMSVNNIRLPDWMSGMLGGFGRNGLNIPTIPMLAKGTDYFRGGAAIVGERGAELVTLPTGSKVYPNDQTESMLGGVTITGNHFVVREEADINKIARQLYDLQRKDSRGR